jgi:catalase
MNDLLKKIKKIKIGIAIIAATIIAFGFQIEIYGQETTSKPPTSTPTEFVDALNFAFGKQTTQRATHAKGIVLLGKFTPSATAATLSKALHFKQAVPVTIRFSDNTGTPMPADTDPLASPHGMALKFHLPDGTETDLVTHSFNGFPAPNADELRQFFIAVGSSGSGVASPTPIEKYMAAHPAAKAFLTTQDPPPISYGTIAYFGVNSFKFINTGGKITFGRYRIIPDAGKHFLSKEEIAKAAPGYLSDEIRRRVAKSPVRFKFSFQLAEAGDKIEDPSIAWSDKNKVIELGILEITSVVLDSEAAERTLLFMPGLLPDGIEPADPMIQFRNKTYPISYDRRHQ